MSLQLLAPSKSGGKSEDENDEGVVRVVLVMIVKNEEANVARVLASAAGLADAFAIADTGSTDSTVDVIEAVAARLGRPCSVTVRDFDTFGAARTHSMRNAEAVAARLGWPAHSTFALLLDADALLKCDPARVRAALSVSSLGQGSALGSAQGLPSARAGAFYVTHALGSTRYSRLNLLRMDGAWTCVGAAHESWQAGVPAPTASLRDEVVVWELGTGGMRGSKARREIALLELDYAAAPTCSRTLFYLGRAHVDGAAAGACPEADRARGLALLRERVAHPAFREEAFEARVLLCADARAAGDTAVLLPHAMQGVADAPTRPELLYAAAQALRWKDEARAAACELLLVALRRCVPPAGGASAAQRAFRDAWVACAAAVAHPGRSVADVDAEYAARTDTARMFLNEAVVRYGLFEELAISASWTDAAAEFAPKGARCNAFLAEFAPDPYKGRALERAARWYTGWYTAPRAPRAPLTPLTPAAQEQKQHEPPDTSHVVEFCAHDEHAPPKRAHD